MSQRDALIAASMTAVLVEAIKELTTRLEALEAL